MNLYICGNINGFMSTYSSVKQGKHNAGFMCAGVLMSKTLAEQQQSSHSRKRMTDCVTERERENTEKRVKEGRKKKTEREGKKEE